MQDAVGRAAALLGAARAYLFATIGDLWETLEAGQEVSLRQRADFQVVHTQVFAMCTEAVELLYKARGGSAVYAGNVLDRCLRDVVTMNQHVINSLRTYAMGGSSPPRPASGRISDLAWEPHSGSARAPEAQTREEHR